jgi:hypothetical protein
MAIPVGEENGDGLQGLGQHLVVGVATDMPAN